jgi:hypothetical protein
VSFSSLFFLEGVKGILANSERKEGVPNSSRYGANLPLFAHKNRNKP